MKEKLFDKLKYEILDNFVDLECSVCGGLEVIDDFFTEDQIFELVDLYKKYYMEGRDIKGFDEYTPYTVILQSYFQYFTELLRLINIPTMQSELLDKLAIRLFKNIIEIYNYLKDTNPVIIKSNSRIILATYFDEKIYSSGEEFYNSACTYFLLVLSDKVLKEIEHIIDDNIEAFTVPVYQMSDSILVKDPINVLLFNIILNFEFSESFILKHFNILPPWILLKQHSTKMTEKSLKKIVGDGMTFFMNEILDRTSFHKLQNKFSTNPDEVDAEVLALLIKG